MEQYKSDCETSCFTRKIGAFLLDKTLPKTKRKTSLVEHNLFPSL